MIRTSLATFLLPAVLFAGQAFAADAKPPMVGFLDTGKAHCWIRQYDAKHMAAHPKQKVTGIAIAYQPTMKFAEEPAPVPQWEVIDGKAYFSARLAVTFKDEKRTAFGGVRCEAGKSKTQLACFLDEDAGSFTFSDGGADKVQIDVPKSLGLYFANPPGAPDGAPDDGTMLEAKDDQATFILTAAKGGLCEAE